MPPLPPGAGTLPGCTRLGSVATLLGASVAAYTVESVAGRGGMGVVYRARDAALGRTVALKLIAPDLARDEGFRARFVREARVTAQLDHPNVIPVLDAGEDDGRLYIAMRWVEGTDLGRLIHERGALDPAEAAELVAQAASALDAAHRQGLVHRDVKPANLLLPAGDGRRPHVYLTDFGLAKRDESTALTTTGHWLGTPDFASPEQIEGRELDARSDVYALGCVLYTALVGAPPFAAVPALRKGWAQVEEPPPLDRVPKPMRRVLARALAKDPADRHQTAGELGEEACEAAAGRSRRRTAATRRLGSSPTVRLTRRRPGRRAALAVLGAILAAGVAAAAWLATGTFSDDDPAAAPARSQAEPPALAAPSPTGGTVRCDETNCTQAGGEVQAPIDGGTCGTGEWTRLDADYPALYACDGGTPTTSGPIPVPDLAGARLDLAEGYLDGLGVAHDTSGGGAFGVIVPDAWVVCGTTPEAGATLAETDGLTLFVDRSC